MPDDFRPSPNDTVASQTVMSKSHRSNPFATRYTRPGAIRYCFHRDRSGTDPVDAECGAMEAAIGELVASLVRCRVGLIVGPHGTGKTTLLHTLGPTLHRQFPAVDAVQLKGCESIWPVSRWRHRRRCVDQVQDALSAGLTDSAPPHSTPAHPAAAHSVAAHPAAAHRAPTDSLLVIDGAEQLSRVSWRRLVRRARRDGRYLLATSHRPMWGARVLYRTGLDARLVCSLTRGLIADAPADIAEIVEGELERHDLDRVANLRDLWFEFYDVVQPRLSIAVKAKPIEQAD